MATAADDFGFVPDKQSTSNNNFGFVPDEVQIPSFAPGREKGLQNTLKAFIKDPIGDVRAAADFVNEGQRRFLTGIAGVGDYISDKAFGTNKTAALNAQAKAKEAEFNAKYAGNPAADVGVFVSENLPLLLTGGIGNISKASSVPRLIGKNAAFGAGAGAVMYGPDQSVPEKAAMGAVTQGIAGPLLSKGMEGYEKARLAKLFGTASPEEVTRNAKMAGNLPVGLGDVIESPGLKRLQENVLARVPGSGVSTTQRIVADAIRDRGENLLKTIKGNYQGKDINADIGKILDDTSAAVHQEKRNLYNALDASANKAGLTITAPNYQRTAKEILDEIKSNPFQDLKKEDSLISMLESATGEKSGTLKNANIFRGQLGDAISQATRDGDLYKVKVLKSLKKGLDEDIDSAFMNSGKPELKEAYQKSQKFYHENIGPLEENEITRFTRKDADTDLLLSSFIKTGQNDRSILAEKLMSVLGDKNKNLPGYGYLKRAVEKREDGSEYVDARKLSQLIDKLKSGQFETLFPDSQVRKQLKDYVSLTKKNGEALTQMHNPKTGQRMGELALTGIGGMVTEAMLRGGTPTATLTALGGIAGTIGSSRLANKFLTSPKVREMYLKSMQKGDRKLPDVLKNTLTVLPSTDR
jgi:hypothetical protein